MNPISQLLEMFGSHGRFMERLGQSMSPLRDTYQHSLPGAPTPKVDYTANVTVEYGSPAEIERAMKRASELLGRNLEKLGVGR